MLPDVLSSLAPVLARFPLVAGDTWRVERQATGGFSGADVWRIAAGARRFALRAWPPGHPSPERLAWMHAVLADVDRAARERGETLQTPVPAPTAGGETFVHHDGRLWELAPWLDGIPGDRLPWNSERALAACRALARWHVLAESVRRPCPGFESLGPVAPSPGLSQRREQLLRWAADGFETPAAAARRGSERWPEFARLASDWQAAARRAAVTLAPRLDAAARRPVRLQICLRDVRFDHFLFGGERAEDVTGCVDFGALRPDSVAGDLARMLGSFPPLDAELARRALAAYQTIRPLEPYEQELVAVFDASGTLLGGGNWIQWIAIDGREFPDPDAVLARFRALVERLRECGGRR